jgi:hypothetical protein
MRMGSSLRGIVGAAAMSAALVIAGHAYAATPITSCGMSVVGNAVLVANLDCSSHAGPALSLDGRLKLNGFTLTGNADQVAGTATVDCGQNGRCRVQGPGAIHGGTYGVSGNMVKLKKLQISGALTGVAARSAYLKDVKIIDNGLIAPGEDEVVDGLYAGGGIYGHKLFIVGSEIRNNGWYGVLGLGDTGELPRVHRSTVVDNGSVAAYCDRVVGCADFVQMFNFAPILKQTVCETSLLRDTGETLGICSLD